VSWRRNLWLYSMKNCYVLLPYHAVEIYNGKKCKFMTSKESTIPLDITEDSENKPRSNNFLCQIAFFYCSIQKLKSARKRSRFLFVSLPIKHWK
jgi:hypothetical protein